MKDKELLLKLINQELRTRDYNLRGDACISDENIEEKSTKLSKSDYEELVKNYKDKPLPKKYYKDYREGQAWCVCNPYAKIYTIDGWKMWCDLKIGELVLTGQGRFKPIRDLKLLTTNDEVVRIYYDIPSRTLVDNKEFYVTVTRDHPLQLLINTWVRADEVRPGTKLQVLAKHCKSCGKKIIDDSHTSDYCSELCYLSGASDLSYNLKYEFTNIKVKKVDILPLTSRSPPRYVCHIEVADDHTYFVQGLKSKNCQFHVRGILPKDKKAYEAGDKSFKEIIKNHSLHSDLRLSVGLKQLVQFVITESDVESYIRVYSGGINKDYGNVQKAKVVSKPSGEPPEAYKPKSSSDEILLDEEGSKLVAKYMIHDKSYFIEPGGIGATKNKYAYMGFVWGGVVRTAIQRRDFS